MNFKLINLACLKDMFVQCEILNNLFSWAKVKMTVYLTFSCIQVQLSHVSQYFAKIFLYVLDLKSEHHFFKNLLRCVYKVFISEAHFSN